MSGYRFCRTDDIGLLVDALNRCWAPYFPDEPPVTPAAFKRSIRDLQVWCSSCMVAFSGADPVGVLIGAKRAAGTLVHRIAVHPDHRRQGHGRHLLDSLGSKLAILGPPRIVAEVPDAWAPACDLFDASGYVQEAVLTDYALEGDGVTGCEAAGRFVIPVSVEDLTANGLAEPGICWSRSIETLSARQADIAGVAIASDEQIEACILYVLCGDDSEGSGQTAEIMTLRCLIADGGARLKQLLAHVRASGVRAFRFLKVHASEVPADLLATLGFRALGAHRLYAADCRDASGGAR